MLLIVLISALALVCWALAFICLKGSDLILLSGISTANKKEKAKFREQYDVRAMNKCIGKLIFVPVAIVTTAAAITELMRHLELYLPSLYGTAITIGTIAAIIICIVGTVFIFNGKFEKK